MRRCALANTLVFDLVWRCFRWKLECSKAYQATLRPVMGHRAAGPSEDDELRLHYGLLVAWRRYLHREALKNNELLKTIMKADERYTQVKDTRRPAKPAAEQNKQQMLGTSAVMGSSSEAFELFTSGFSLRLTQLEERNSTRFSRFEANQDRLLELLRRDAGFELQGQPALPLPPPPAHGSKGSSFKSGKNSHRSAASSQRLHRA
jgi:hypothetical protein